MKFLAVLLIIIITVGVIVEAQTNDYGSAPLPTAWSVTNHSQVDHVDTNSSPVDIFVQPIKTHLESREEIIRQLRAEVVQLHNQIASMPTPPLPVYVPDILHIRQLDTNTWRLTLSDGYEFVQLKATNGVSAVVFLQRK